MNEPKPVRYECGNCFHWQEVERRGPALEIGAQKIGVCFGAPPTVRPALDSRGNLIGQGNLRPMMNQNERACGGFMPLESVNGAANDLNG